MEKTWWETAENKKALARLVKERKANIQFAIERLQMTTKNHPVKSFVIDRAKWGKGRLHNKDGSMCCLGFLGKACGVTEKEMGNAGYPCDLSEAVKAKFPKWSVDVDVYADGNDVGRLVSLNDDSKPSEKGARRCKADVEKYIAKTFAKYGIKVTFKGKAKKS